MVVALQQQVAPIRGAIEAQQPGGVRLLVDLLLLASAPGPQLPGAQGAGFVGDGVEGLAIQAPEQIAGPVGQGGQGLAVGQIKQGDAVIPIALQIFGQGQPAPVRVQGPAGELVVAAGRLAGRQPLAGLSLLAAALPQAAVGFHPPLAARLAQPLLRHGFTACLCLPFGLQSLLQRLLSGELLLGPAVLLAQQGQQGGILVAVIAPAAIGIEPGPLPRHRQRAVRNKRGHEWRRRGDGLTRGAGRCNGGGLGSRRSGQQAGQHQECVHQSPTKV